MKFRGINQEMWNAFIHGKTHDLYGLIILFFILAYLFSFTYGHFTVSMLIAIGIAIVFSIFADIWAHGFHH